MYILNILVVSLLCDLLVVTLKLLKEDGDDTTTTRQQPAPGIVERNSLIAQLAVKATDNILKPILIQQRNSVGQVEFDLIDKYVRLSTVAMKYYMKIDDLSAASAAYYRVMEVIEGLNVIQMYQSKLKKNVSDDLLALFLQSFKLFTL